jgi:hypothetical protein
MPITTQLQHITDIIDTALVWIGDQAFLTQSRCIDVFLDLFQATTDPFARWSIADEVTEIRFLRTVRGDTMRAALVAIAAAAAADEHVDGDWCDRLVESCVHAMSGLFAEAG